MAKAGRPKSTFADTLKTLPDTWEEQVLALYANGGCDTEVQAMFIRNGWRPSLSNDLWQRWMIEEPVFSDVIKRGHRMSEAWWLRLGREAATGETEVNVPIWIFNMKNRMRWADRQDVTTRDETPKDSRSEVDEELRRAGIDPEKYWEERKTTRH